MTTHTQDSPRLLQQHGVRVRVIAVTRENAGQFITGHRVMGSGATRMRPTELVQCVTRSKAQGVVIRQVIVVILAPVRVVTCSADERSVRAGCESTACTHMAINAQSSSDGIQLRVTCQFANDPVTHHAISAGFNEVVRRATQLVGVTIKTLEGGPSVAGEKD